MTLAAPETERPPDQNEWPEQLAVRIARCYYELGMTQKEIADHLDVGRARVIKLLSEARERGVVTIAINSPLVENEELSDALCQRYGLLFSEVCLSHTDDEHQLAAQVAAAAGPRVRSRLRDGMTIGLGWGVTLKELANRMQHKPLQNVVVAALLGSLTRRSTVTRFEATTDLAARLNAECLYLPAPIVCDSRNSRTVLMEQPLFAELQARALAADVAVVSIGGLDSATIRAVGLVEEAEFASVCEHGAIGNFLGYYIDIEGNIVQHSINERIIGIAGEQFMEIPERIMISAGPNKLLAIRTVLERGFVNALITDQTTAKALLQ